MKTSDPLRVSKELLAGAVFIIGITLLSHFAFSWMGFTPTDEGFTLAHSRRLLDGQAPHRDFIIIRPFFSPLIHVPFVLFGGSNTFWLSRLFVWFELASIAWLWTTVIGRLLEFHFPISQRLAAALIAFAATTHTKHITAWHSIDGLLFIAVGTVLCLSEKRFAKLAGYCALGLAALCKQSFLFVAPLTLFTMGDWRAIRYWLAAVAPGFGYVVYLLFAHAFFDAWQQLTAHREFFTAGVLHYVLAKRFIVALVIGYAAAHFLGSRGTNVLSRSKPLIGIAVLYCGSLLVAGAALWFGVMLGGAFALFGFCSGSAIWLLLSEGIHAKRTKAFLLVIATAWSVSLSGGYNSPALMAGPLVVVMVTCVLRAWPPKNFFRYSLPLAAVGIALCFGVGRSRYIYRDRPATELTQPLEAVLVGGKHIYTNPNTFAFMSDLNTAVRIARAQAERYAILPDVAAYWVTAPERNPLPAVWPHRDELATRPLTDRYFRAMEAGRANTVFIVQKVEAKDLAHEFVPLPSSDYYEVVRYVRTRFTKVNETTYFEMYR